MPGISSVGNVSPGVDNDDFVGVFKSCQIFAYFTHAAEKNYLYLFVFVRLFLPCAARSSGA